MNFVCALFAVHHKPRYGPVFTEKREETERGKKKKISSQNYKECRGSSSTQYIVDQWSFVSS
jgi:hypothetical protein